MELSSDANEQPGQYGRYQIISELGRGSMGVVYKAHDPFLDRPIALKVLRRDRITSNEYIRRFEKEAKAVARLSHPGIVTVHDVGQDHGSIFIAMEFLQGSPLDDLLEKREFSLQGIIEIGLQSAQALHYAHQRGVIHRDIKPSNIIYSPEGTVRITDFGIAHIEDPNDLHMTQVGEVLGTPRYMSPEQFMGQAVDGRSDFFSLGIILYQLTTGKRPFDGPTQAAIFRSIIQDSPEAPHCINPQISESLSLLVMRLLAKEPSDRFADGGELIDALSSCQSALMAQQKGPPEFSESILVTGRGKMLMTGVAFFLLIGLGASGYYFWGMKSKVAQKADPAGTASFTNTSGEPKKVEAVMESTSKTPQTQPTFVNPALRELNELLREGIALSISVADLPKKKAVLESAQDLAKISPRYQEDLQIAETIFNTARANQEKRLATYLDELSIVKEKDTPEQITQALEHIKNETLSERQKNTIAVIEDHLRSLKNGVRLSEKQILEDFSQHFSNFVD